MSEETDRTSRIVLGLNPAIRAAALIDLIRHLVADRAAELSGVFVEDAALLEHARSRLAREVLLSGAERPLDTAALSRQIRAQSQQVRSDFEAAARKLGLPHSFQLARGEVLAELARRAVEAEALVVTSLGTAAKMRAWRSVLEQLSPARLSTLLLAREGWNTGRTILAVLDDVTGTALAAARRLADRTASPMSLILSGAAAEDAASPGLSGANVAGAAAELKAGAIVATARRTHSRIVVVPWQHAASDADLIDALLRGTDSAVLIVK